MKMKYRIVDSDNSNISFLIINYVSCSKVVQVGIMHSTTQVVYQRKSSILGFSALFLSFSLWELDLMFTKYI